jgi:diacylglycerol kinase
MPESLRTRLTRHFFNLVPAYRGTGGRVKYIASDWRELRVEVPLSLRTRNYVGTIYGGSMYGAVDPFYMIMLIRGLGPGYVVWDKSATIRFLRPGRTTLHASFRIDDAELSAIRTALEAQRSVDRTYLVELADRSGEVHATVEKVVYVRRKDSPGEGGAKELAPHLPREDGAPAQRREGLGASFGHAFRGLVEVTARERNMKLHVLAGVGLGVFCGEVPLPPPAEVALLLCAALVLAAELGNSALESLVDLVTRELRLEARRAKDAAAGAVLVLAAGSAMVAAQVLGVNRAQLAASLPRLLSCGPAAVTVLALTGWLLVPGRRARALDALAAISGAALLVVLSLRSQSPLFTVLAVLLFALSAASARFARAEGRR